MSKLSTSTLSERKKPFVKIIEQPAEKELRFRYESECAKRNNAGSLKGANCTSTNKTYPTIKVCGYKGPAFVIVSCVSKDEPYRPHPHRIIGREGCEGGVCKMKINPETMTISFMNLGIQCVKIKEIEQELNLRQRINVDPFNTGFDHKNDPNSIDMINIRLCFQVFLGEETGRFVYLAPVVSDIVIDKKKVFELSIVEMSHCTCPVDRNEKIIMLCDKISHDDIEVRFYEEKDGQIIWERNATIDQVYRQNNAIIFRPPQFYRLDITDPCRVLLQLRKPSDDSKSSPRDFEYWPRQDAPGKRKRLNTDKTESLKLFQQQMQLDLNLHPILESSRPAQGEAIPSSFSQNNFLMGEPTFTNNQIVQNMQPINNNNTFNLPSTSYASTTDWNISPESYDHLNLPITQNFPEPNLISPSIDCENLFQNLFGN